MYGLKIVTAPIADAVSLTSMKLFLRVDNDDEDTLIESLRDAATELVQDRTGRQFVQATFDMTWSGFPGSQPIAVARAPLASVESVKYYDRDDVLQTLDPINYLVHDDREPGLIARRFEIAWPATACRDDALTVRFIAGYPGVGSPAEPAGAVPGRATTAIKQLVAAWYEQRGIGDIPPHVGRLINSLRVWKEA